MRYAAETAQMEKEGSLERPGDWDSLSDRMRKMRSRAHQKTLMQQHKEAALLADRKDALTKRPLDFDREEETRKGETMKWLESHFGSESTASNESREDVDADVEPTKRTYFKVTIKSNQATTPALVNGHKTAITPPVAQAYERHVPLPSTTRVVNNSSNNNNNKYYQGITNWAERQEPTAPPTSVAQHFSTQAFREDLRETVERNRLRKQGAQAGSRDRLHETVKDNYVSREDIIHQKRQSLSSQFLARSRRGSREQLDEPDVMATLPPHKEVARSRPVYLRANTMELNGGTQRRSPLHFNQAVRRNEYVDARSKSYEHELNDVQQESEHYESRTLNRARRSPSPEPLLQSHTLGRPSVPQRRRAIEKKLQRQQQIAPAPPATASLKVQLEPARGVAEPPPDYSPPPRSRSSSPQLDYSRRRGSVTIAANGAANASAANTLQRKQHQRTRFAPTTPQQETRSRPLMATQTTQTTPSTISTSTANSHKSSSRMGQVIGNSLRKLVRKIRSASAERKLRRKSKSKSREQSPTPPALERQNSGAGITTYQQYNVIDGHIGGQPALTESERESLQQEPVSIELESAPPNFRETRRGESVDSEQAMSPRQRYYLGEDPYSSTLYGKENIYDPESLAKRQRASRAQLAEMANGQRDPRLTRRPDEIDHYNQRAPSTHTLGRYQKSTNRFAGSTPNLTQDYRNTQTLPRKLHEPQTYVHQQQAQQHHQHQYQKRLPAPIAGNYSTLGHPERRTPYTQQTSGTLAGPGPAKPARTYAKALNRSRSFSVHGINGGVDPSPIYMEKMTKNNYNNNNNSTNHNNLQSSQAYKSNPHLYSGHDAKETGMLKSPSIVNLISRSQRDLSKFGTASYDDERIEERRNTTLYKPVGGHGVIEDYGDVRKAPHYQLHAKHSLPVELNKDTASIMRRENDYNNHTTPRGNDKRNILMYRDEQKRRGSGATIIELRHK